MIGVNKIKKSLTIMFVNTALLTTSLNAATPLEQYFSTTKLDKIAVKSDTTNSNTIAVETGQIKAPSNDWNAYQITFGKEKIISFVPNTPLFTRMNDTWGTTIATKSKVEYWLMAPVPAKAGIKKEDLFPMFIELYSKSPYKSVSYKIKEDNGFSILEISCLNKKAKKIEKTRVILSGENFYVVQMKYPTKLDGKIDTAMYLESIKLLKQ